MITVNELFSGIGAQVAALRRIRVPYQVVGISEIDKHAIKSYEAINGATRNYGDISKVERLDYADLWTYSFPCQDLSIAGKQLGLNGTRSGLLLEVERLLKLAVAENNAPKYLLMENVKNLVGKKFKPDFDKWLSTLNNLGYNNYWKVLNAKDYGVPQNRERVFVVSIRKDIDTHGYTFPEPFKLTRRLKDVLETNVDECYYLREELVEKFVERLKARAEKKVEGDDGTDINDLNAVSEPLAAASRGRYAENPLSRESGLPTEQQLEINKTGCSNTSTAVGKDNLVVEPQIGLYGNIHETNTQSGRVYDKEKIAPTLDCMGGGNREPKIIEDGICLKVGNIYPSNGQNGNIYSTDGCSHTILSGTGVSGNGVGSNNEPKIIEGVIDSTQKNAYVGSLENVSPCPTTATGMGGGQIPMVSVQPFNTCKDGSAQALTAHLHKETVNDCTKLDRHSPALGVIEIGIGHNPISKKFEFDGFHENKPCPTLLATDYKCPKCYSDAVRIRKLTPKECWRLMDFTDEEFEAAQKAGVSKTQLYKQAGNSIVVGVLAKIFERLFKNETL